MVGNDGGPGILVEVLILTHERSKPDDYDAYLVHRLHPLRPILAFGRSAAAEPPTQPRFAVYSWWRETVSGGRGSIPKRAEM